jgi:hypothetical protein
MPLNPFNPLPPPTGLETTLFPPTSRYHGLAIKRWQQTDGQRVPYVARRFVPHQERFETLREHTVVQGDRLDNLSAQYLGDPEQFWRVADANNQLDPSALTLVAGDVVRITLPEGIPGLSNPN